MPIFKIWVSIALEDPTAFQLILANGSALLHQTYADPQDENLEAAKLYTRCLREVNLRLQDKTDSVSEGLICAILGFACRDV